MKGANITSSPEIPAKPAARRTTSPPKVYDLGCSASNSWPRHLASLLGQFTWPIYLDCLAMTRALIFAYVAAGTIFLFTRSVFVLYGRPSMIFCEYASPMPGSAFN